MNDRLKIVYSLKFAAILFMQYGIEFVASRKILWGNLGVLFRYCDTVLFEGVIELASSGPISVK